MQLKFKKPCMGYITTLKSLSLGLHQRWKWWRPAGAEWNCRSSFPSTSTPQHGFSGLVYLVYRWCIMMHDDSPGSRMSWCLFPLRTRFCWSKIQSCCSKSRVQLIQEPVSTFFLDPQKASLIVGPENTVGCSSWISLVVSPDANGRLNFRPTARKWHRAALHWAFHGWAHHSGGPSQPVGELRRLSGLGYLGFLAW